MGTRKQRERQEELWVPQGLGRSSGTSFLSAAARSIGASGFRRVLRNVVPEVLSRDAGSSIAGSRNVLSPDVQVETQRARNLLSLPLNPVLSRQPS